MFNTEITEKYYYLLERQNEIIDSWRKEYYKLQTENEQLKKYNKGEKL